MLEDEKTIRMSELGSVAVAYLDSGRGNPVLLYLHGIQGSKESYQHFLKAPLLRQARILVPDIPGFGASRGPEDLTFELQRQAERLISFLDSLGIEKVAVYGHSLGGMLGTLLLEQAPQRILGLISSDGNLRLEDCGESRRVATMSFEEFVATRYPDLQKRGIKTDTRVFYETAKSVVEVAESERLLSLLVRALCPVLFIRGGATHFATVPVGDNIRNLEIPRETHFTLSESKASVEAIAEFLVELSG
jgi:pimeloyl-ACP methyl ester carboxylesterase